MATRRKTGRLTMSALRTHRHVHHPQCGAYGESRREYSYGDDHCRGSVRIAESKLWTTAATAKVQRAVERLRSGAVSTLEHMGEAYRVP